MSPVVKQSRELYRLFVRFYPDTIQRKFGAEMVDVFEAQMADAWAEKGVPGFVRVWCCVMAELLDGPATLGFLQTAVCVPAISLLGSFALFLLFFWGTGLAKACH